MSKTPYPLYKKIGFLLGPVIFLIILFWPSEIINPDAQKIIAVAAWMICWWISEAVAIPVTALLPLALFPLVGLMDVKAASVSYGHPIVFLFFGGFIIALALERVNLHRRIALNIIKLTGTKANGVVLGFMLATALMSMWISNTASTVVMLPIAVSVIGLLIDDADGFTKNDKNFALSIMLGIAFAANVGGTATLVGTPPNSVMLGILQNEFNIDISFVKWMAMGLPFAGLMLFISYQLLVKVFYPNHLGQFKTSGNVIQEEIRKLGKMSRGEKIVSVIFILTALSWILRSNLNQLFPGLDLTDTGISMIGAIAMLVAPISFSKGDFVLPWDETSRLPWGILLLFGGGLALASGLSKAGLIELIGNAIAETEGLNVFWIGALLILVMLFMTELMSNVALVTIFVPVVAGIALGLDVPLLHFVIPVTLASSCAFMLPMATPPNAIVFASGHIKVYEMAKAGIFLNLIAVAVLIALGNWVVPWIFG